MNCSKRFKNWKIVCFQKITFWMFSLRVFFELLNNACSWIKNIITCQISQNFTTWRIWNKNSFRLSIYFLMKKKSFGKTGLVSKLFLEKQILHKNSLPKKSRFDSSHSPKKTFTMNQVLKQNFHKVSDFERKLFVTSNFKFKKIQRVRFWNV